VATRAGGERGQVGVRCRVQQVGDHPLDRVVVDRAERQHVAVHGQGALDLGAGEFDGQRQQRGHPPFAEPGQQGEQRGRIPVRLVDHDQRAGLTLHPLGFDPFELRPVEFHPIEGTRHLVGRRQVLTGDQHDGVTAVAGNGDRLPQQGGLSGARRAVDDQQATGRGQEAENRSPFTIPAVQFRHNQDCYASRLTVNSATRAVATVFT
jgi:hypothetical protein